MRDLKILTDIRISRSPQWTEKTRHLGDASLKKMKSLKVPGQLMPFLNLIQILKNIKKFDCIINADIKTAQLFGLCRSLFRIKTPKHIVLELMLDEEQDNLYWKLKRSIQRFIFSSVDVIFISSTHEIAIYAKRLNKSEKHFKFLPFHTNIMEPGKMKCQDYVLSAGRTGRDYGVLAEAVRDLDMEVIVVGDEHSVKGINFPSNVTVLVEVPYMKYLDLLYNCRFVVVPLRKVVKSTGQVAFLEAMATGKPVIATETVGTKDYIQSGINGILVPPEDPVSLREAIHSLIKNPSLENEISLNALESVKNLYTLEKYCSTILNTAAEVVRGNNLQ